MDYENEKAKPVVTMFSCSVSVGHGAPFNVHIVSVNGRLFLEVAGDEGWIGVGRVRGVMREVERGIEEVLGDVGNAEK